MLTIRLSRIGKKNKPMYRLMISEKSKDPYGRALEILGSYNPHTKELITKKERIEYWLNQGSQMSPTVNNLLVEKGVIKGDKVKASIARKKKKAKDEEKPAEKAPEKTEEKTIEEKKEETIEEIKKEEVKSADAKALADKEEAEKPAKETEGDKKEENKQDDKKTDKNDLK